LTLVLYGGGQMSEPKILELFGSVGVQISAGQLSNLLIKDQDVFHAEKNAVYAAGLQSSPWQHLDETGTRVNGQNHHCHIVCNPLYTAYHTTPSKDRLSVLDVLRNGQPRTFRCNAEALGYWEQLGLSVATRQTLTRLPGDQNLDEASLRQWLEEHLPHLGPQQCKWILDATAVAAYHAQVEFPVVRLLVCDDAPQFNWVTEELALCWVHEGRHYKKLTPYVLGPPAAGGRFPGALLGLLRRVADLSAAADGSGACTAGSGVRCTVLDRDGLPRPGRADSQDPGEESVSADGLEAPGDSAA
jgi:hypothetical protein